MVEPSLQAVQTFRGAIRGADDAVHHPAGEPTKFHFCDPSSRRRRSPSIVPDREPCVDADSTQVDCGKPVSKGNRRAASLLRH
jgi:hypothetical protein